MENIIEKNEEMDVVVSSVHEKNKTYLSAIQNAQFIVAKDNFGREKTVLRLTLVDGYKKDLNVDEDSFHLYKVLASRNNNKAVKSMAFMKKISKKKEKEYVSLDLTLINGSVVSALVPFALLDVLNILGEIAVDSTKK